LYIYKIFISKALACCIFEGSIYFFVLTQKKNQARPASRSDGASKK